MKKVVIFVLMFVLLSVPAFAARLTVGYDVSDVEVCEKNCVYTITSGYTLGFASPVADSVSDSMSLTATVSERDDDIYIVFTKPNTELSEREDLIEEINEKPNPSFAYPIKTLYSVIVGLDYSDIQITGRNIQLGPGIYPMLFKNNGTNTAGDTQVVVEII